MFFTTHLEKIMQSRVKTKSGRRKVLTIPFYNRLGLLNVIKKIIDKYDFEGLLKIGAPKDEYYHEAERLYNVLITIKEWDETTIRMYLINTFEYCFGHEDQQGFKVYRLYDDYTPFTKAAKEIANNIRWYHRAYYSI
jgi:hypothetical protein